jgi:hypothetical protein
VLYTQHLLARYTVIKVIIIIKSIYNKIINIINSGLSFYLYIYLVQPTGTMNVKLIVEVTLFRNGKTCTTRIHICVPVCYTTWRKLVYRCLYTTLHDVHWYVGACTLHCMMYTDIQAPVYYTTWRTLVYICLYTTLHDVHWYIRTCILHYMTYIDIYVPVYYSTHTWPTFICRGLYTTLHDVQLYVGACILHYMI